MKKRVISCFFMLILCSFMGREVYASSINEAKQEKKTAEQDLNNVQDSIDAIEDNKDEVTSQVQELDSKLTDLLVTIEVLNGELTNKQVELEQVQADLAVAKENEQIQHENMKKRIRFMYERGEQTVLSAFLEAQSISELLSRLEYVSDMYEFDRNLLLNYQATKLQVQQLETQVLAEKQELETMQAELEIQQKELASLITKKRAEIVGFDNQLAQAKVQAAQIQQEIEEKNRYIKEQEEKALLAEKQRQKELEEQQRKKEKEEQEKQQNANNNNNNSNNNNNGETGGGTTNEGNGNKPSDKPPVGGNSGVDGNALVDYASGFIGNPYILGGTSLTSGADCSGFTQSVFSNFGVSIPRTSSEQRYAGVEVDYSDARAGDLICYSGHVGIYMGNGQIVHASNSSPYPAGGIKTSRATYRTILSVRRVL